MAIIAQGDARLAMQIAGGKTMLRMSHDSLQRNVIAVCVPELHGEETRATDKTGESSPATPGRTHKFFLDDKPRARICGTV